jgi:hypothetical protein
MYVQISERRRLSKRSEFKQGPAARPSIPLAVSPPHPRKFVDVAVPASEYKTHWGSRDAFAVCTAFKPIAIGGKLERLALCADTVTLRAFMPLRKPDRGHRTSGLHLPSGKLRRHGWQSEVFDTQLRGKSGLVDYEGGRPRGCVQIIKPHRHE